MNIMEGQEIILRRILTKTIILVQFKQYLLVVIYTHHNHMQMTQYPT